MNSFEEGQFKQRIHGAMMRSFNSPNAYADVVNYQKIGECIPDEQRGCPATANLYRVELSLQQSIRLNALVFDTGYECFLWLDSGSLFSLIIQPAMEKFSREHPWLLGI